MPLLYQTMITRELNSPISQTLPNGAALEFIVKLPNLAVTTIPATARTNIPPKEWITVDFHHPHQIVAPAFTRVLAWHEGQLKLVSICQLTPGMRVAFMTKFDPPCLCSELHIPQSILDVGIGEPIQLRPLLALDRASGQTFGAVYGDGWPGNYPYEVGLFLANKHECVASAFLSGVMALAIPQCGAPGDIAHVQMRSRPMISPHGSTIQRFVRSSILNELTRYMLGHLANCKRVPVFALLAPHSFRTGFIEGLLGTDGSVAFTRTKSEISHSKEWNVSLSTTSPHGALGIHNLLCSVGLANTVTQCSQSQDHAILFLINIRHADIADWQGSIIRVDRQARLSEIQTQYSAVKRGSVIATPELYPHLLPFAQFAGIHRAPLHKATHHWGAMERDIRDRIVQVIPARLLEGSPRLANWVNATAHENLRWLQVQRVENGIATATLAIARSRRLGPDHMQLVPMNLEWPVSNEIFLASNGAMLSGV